MATYQVTLKNGEVYEVDTNEQDIKSNLSDKMKSLPKKAWDALTIPEKKSAEGLRLIADATPEFVPQSAVKRAVGTMLSPIIGPIGSLAGEIAARSGTDTQGPTGNLPMDILRGTPKVLAETAQKSAPSFVSRGAIVASAIGPILKSVGTPTKFLGKKVASAIEGYQNTPKGTLAEAYRDPSIYLDKGAAVAGKTYREAKLAAGGNSEGLFGKITDLKNVSKIKLENVVDRALELAKEGKLNPASAQSARKAVDEMYKSKSYSKEAVLELRQFFDSIVKGDAGLAKADIAYQRAIKADALRQIFPLNKGGGGSPFRIFSSSNLSGIPFIGKPLAFISGSPAIAGLTAAGAGDAARTLSNPITRAGAVSALNALTKKKIGNTKNK